MESQKIDLDEWENWDKLKPETAQFILDQSEKNLIEINNAADVLTARSNTILQFSIPSIIVLTGYIYSDYSKGDLLTHLAAIAIVILSLITILAFIANSLYKVVPLGNRPVNMINNEKVLHDDQYLVFLFNSIKNIQKSITKNESKNVKRASKLYLIEKIIWVGLVFELLIYPLLYFLVVRL